MQKSYLEEQRKIANVLISEDQLVARLEKVNLTTQEKIPFVGAIWLAEWYSFSVRKPLPGPTSKSDILSQINGPYQKVVPTFLL